MATIRVVENPRRKKRRRYTAKQRAAGFGGRRTMSRRRPPRRRRSPRRRRNPMMASLGNPRRRNSPRRRPRYTVTGVARRRRRNPRLMPFNIDLMSAVWIGTGALSTQILPGLGKRFWSGLPTTGTMGYLTQMAAAIVAGMLVGKITNRHNGSLVTAGGLSVIFVNVIRQYVMPRISFLNGLGNDASTMSAQELRDIYGVGAYVDTPGMAGYVENPVGAF